MDSSVKESGLPGRRGEERKTANVSTWKVIAEPLAKSPPTLSTTPLRPAASLQAAAHAEVSSTSFPSCALKARRASV